MVIKIKKLVEEAIIPPRGSKDAAGYDLCALEGHLLKPGDRFVFKTGLTMEIPSVVYGRVAPRSGLAVKRGIDVMAGVIDPDFLGEIMVVLINLGNDPVTINSGDKIAQIVFEYYTSVSFMEVNQLTMTERGSNGFGSTDKPVLGKPEKIAMIDVDNNIGKSLDEINKELH